MKSFVNIDNRAFTVDLEHPLDISIPLKFNADQPNAYGVDPATSEPCEAGDLIGDTRIGGSCNFEKYTLIPHCNGTHTECVGHITKARIFVRDCLKDTFIPTTLISVKPQSASETQDKYSSASGSADVVISRKQIVRALARSLQMEETNTLSDSDRISEINRFGQCLRGLVIRTIPNDEGKLTQKYGEYVPPFFTSASMEFMVEMGIQHLLVDIPSIDRIFDDGKLENHRKFWSVEPGEFTPNQNDRMNCTITELVYVSNRIKDGRYLLNLQIAPFEADTSPSRPVLLKLVDSSPFERK